VASRAVKTRERGRGTGGGGGAVNPCRKGGWGGGGYPMKEGKKGEPGARGKLEKNRDFSLYAKEKTSAPLKERRWINMGA